MQIPWLNRKSRKHLGSTQHLTFAAVTLPAGIYENWERSIDEVFRKYLPDHKPDEIELHTVDIVRQHRKEPWSTLDGTRIPNVIDEIMHSLESCGVIAQAHVLEKRGYWDYFSIRPEDPGPQALRRLLRRVDVAASMQGWKYDLIIDEDSNPTKTAFRDVINSIQKHGDSLDPNSPSLTNLKRMNSFSFKHSHECRGLQAADFVAYWTQKAAEHGQANRYKQLRPLWKSSRHGPEPWVFPMTSTAFKMLKVR